VQALHGARVDHERGELHVSYDCGGVERRLPQP
jgi:hypothetical protein